MSTTDQRGLGLVTPSRALIPVVPNHGRRELVPVTFLGLSLLRFSFKIPHLGWEPRLCLLHNLFDFTPPPDESPFLDSYLFGQLLGPCLAVSEGTLFLGTALSLLAGRKVARPHVFMIG